MENLDTLPFKGKKELFAKLERLAKIVNLNKRERAEYEESLKIYRDNQGVLDCALESGFMKGLAEGEAKTKNKTGLTADGGPMECYILFAPCMDATRISTNPVSCGTLTKGDYGSISAEIPVIKYN